ncbi:hypothetical protein ACVNNN_14385 [Lysinibacillus fusiformis]|uniref:hypothetical protein n=1 Tax=Lysinibacillus sp. PWR01 TaxID=3342384 RepID=UPI00372D4E32
MHYSAKQPRSSLLPSILFCGTFLLITLGDNFILTLLLSLSLLLCLAGLLVQYDLLIKENEIEYTISLCKVVLFSKYLQAQQIKQILFKRYGWATPGATIITKGFNLRIVYFKPKDVITHLDHFAQLNHLAIRKTKDFRRLRKEEIN